MGLCVQPGHPSPPSRIYARCPYTVLTSPLAYLFTDLRKLRRFPSRGGPPLKYHLSALTSALSWLDWSILASSSFFPGSIGTREPCNLASTTNLIVRHADEGIYIAANSFIADNPPFSGVSAPRTLASRD